MESVTWDLMQMDRHPYGNRRVFGRMLLRDVSGWLLRPLCHTRTREIWMFRGLRDLDRHDW